MKKTEEQKAPKESFDDPSTWAVEDKDEFIETLLMWIDVNDHTYDLYCFLTDIREGKEYAPFTYDKYRAKFEKLFHEELGEEDLVEFYAYQYLKEKERMAELLKEEKEKPVINENTLLLEANELIAELIDSNKVTREQLLEMIKIAREQYSHCMKAIECFDRMSDCNERLLENNEYLLERYEALEKHCDSLETELLLNSLNQKS